MAVLVFLLELASFLYRCYLLLAYAACLPAVTHLSCRTWLAQIAHTLLHTCKEVTPVVCHTYNDTIVQGHCESISQCTQPVATSEASGRSRDAVHSRVATGGGKIHSSHARGHLASFRLPNRGRCSCCHGCDRCVSDGGALLQRLLSFEGVDALFRTGAKHSTASNCLCRSGGHGQTSSAGGMLRCAVGVATPRRLRQVLQRAEHWAQSIGFSA
jgi:hypothetical protein